VQARPHRHKVVVSWSAPGRLPAEAESTFDLDIDDAVAERVRWYLEDYAEFPLDPAPEVAVTAENDLAGLGRGLFTAVFGTGDGARIWAQATVDGLSGVRVEIDADPRSRTGHPHIKHERGLLTYIDARRCCFTAGSRWGRRAVDVARSVVDGVLVHCVRRLLVVAALRSARRGLDAAHDETRGERGRATAPAVPSVWDGTTAGGEWPFVGAVRRSLTSTG